MQKGEVWIVEFQSVNGHEQYGLRPAIIIEDTNTSVVIVIPCTANLHALRFPFTLRLDPSKKNGLDAATVILLIQLRAIDRMRFVRKNGVIEQNTLIKINRLLKTLLGL